MFSFSSSAVVLLALYSILHWKWSKQNYSTPISEMLFTFLWEKLFEKNFSRWKTANQCCKGRCKLQVQNSHTSMSSNWTYHFSHTWKKKKKKKALFAILIGGIIFFTCENHCSLIWLDGIHLCMKMHNIAFWWVFLSMYIINISGLLIFRGKKSKISRDFQGEIRGKIG